MLASGGHGALPSGSPGNVAPSNHLTGTAPDTTRSESIESGLDSNKNVLVLIILGLCDTNLYTVVTVAVNHVKTAW